MRLRLGVAAALGFAGIVGVLLVAVGALSGRGALPRLAIAAGPPPVVAPNVSSDGIPDPTWTPTPTPTNTPTPTPTPTPPPHPASATGLRIWSDGDSTSYYMTLGFFSIMSDMGAIPVRAADYKISSGLANHGSSAVLGVSFSDWPSYMASEMATYAPDVVVFMIGANDAGYAASNPDDYRARVAALMDQLDAPGRYVMWVGQPNITRPDLAPLIPGINAIYAEEAAKRAWVTYVDASSVTSDGGDGVHLSGSAGRAIAQLVVDALLNP
jgi:hypothetical protein